MQVAVALAVHQAVAAISPAPVVQVEAVVEVHC
jgi:hypothetical protein